LPQWNCACHNCQRARAGDPRVLPRTQDSLAFSIDGLRWHIVNASPDVRAQIEQTPALQPRAARHSAVRSIVLTNGDLDHVLGLFNLRESWPLVLYATDAVRRGLEDGNVIFRTLRRFPEQVTWRRLPLGVEVELESGLVVEARPAPGKLPVHLVGVAQPSLEDNVSLWIRDARRSTSAAVVTATSSVDGLEEGLRDVDCVFFDGTFWSGDELVTLGLGTARAEDMAHVPVGGERGSLVRLARLKGPRKIYTHINNTNPMAVAGSPEQEAVALAGCEIAFDGMEIVL
jgi:pyrroloquinoline quinone biosynthesis protein B